MQELVVSYYFEGEGVPTRAFEVSVERPMTPRKGDAAWTLLESNQCANCPLSKDAFSHCPAAVDIELVVDSFNALLEHKTLTTIVIFTGGKEVRRTGPTAEALAALLGLILASCACPILSRMKGMARHHNPFISAEESMVRFVGAYLIGQQIEHQHGHPSDWSFEGLKAFFSDIESVNKALIARLHSAGTKKHAMESISLFLKQAIGMRDAIDEWGPQLEAFGLPAVRAR